MFWFADQQKDICALCMCEGRSWNLTYTNSAMRVNPIGIPSPVLLRRVACFAYGMLCRAICPGLGENIGGAKTARNVLP